MIGAPLDRPRRGPRDVAIVAAVAVLFLAVSQASKLLAVPAPACGARSATTASVPAASPSLGGAATLIAADPPASPGPLPAPEAPTIKKKPKPKISLEDVEERLFSRPSSLVAVVVFKFLAPVAGLIVAVLSWVRRSERKQGIRPPLPAWSPPPAPFGRGGQAVVIGLGLWLLSMGGPGVVLLAGQRLGWASPDGDPSLVENFLAMASVMVPLSILAYAAIRRRRRDAQLSPAPAGPAARIGLLTFLVGSGVILSLHLIAVLVLSAFGRDPAPQELVERLFDPDSPVNLTMMGIYGALIAPITEECIYRGIVFASLREGAGTTSATFISAALFAAVHQDLTALLPLFGLALLLAWAYQRTGSLLAPILIHVANNATSLLPIYLLRA